VAVVVLGKGMVPSVPLIRQETHRTSQPYIQSRPEFLVAIFILWGG